MLSTFFWKQGELSGDEVVFAEFAALKNLHSCYSVFERCKLLFYQQSCIIDVIVIYLVIKCLWFPMRLPPPRCLQPSKHVGVLVFVEKIMQCIRSVCL